LLQTEDYRNKAKTQKNWAGFDSKEDVFCRSETKHNTRTAPRPKLFASAMKLLKQKPQSNESDLVQVPVKKFSLAWKLSKTE
jgi:hypothetical protein